MSMTSNAANVAVCNQSLGLLGASEITVGGTTDQNHIYCTTFFDDARDEILAAHRWNYAKKRAFALETTKPLFGYDNAFTYFTDAIKVWGIDEAPEAVWELEGALILTDHGDRPKAWKTAEIYIVNDYVKVTPDTWATGVAVIDGQYLLSGDLIYEVLVSHTTDTIAADVTANNLISRGEGSEGTYLIAVAHTSDTVAADIAAGNLTPAGGDSEVLAVEYVYQRTDVDAWPISARQSLVINLARMLAPAIKQNEEASLNLQTMLYGGPKTTGYIALARTIDAQEGGPMSVTTRTLLTSRRSRRGYYS
ncbi:MAG TPA: hypothetical protein ENI05_08295 [Porticoccus sp.]|nr:hypothetical protein [Porticoccus sp.]